MMFNQEQEPHRIIIKIFMLLIVNQFCMQHLVGAKIMKIRKIIFLNLLHFIILYNQIYVDDAM